MSKFMRTRHVENKPRPAYFQPRDLLRDKPWREMQAEFFSAARKSTVADYCMIAAMAIFFAVIMITGGLQ
jgi:hypothetical protein